MKLVMSRFFCLPVIILLLLASCSTTRESIIPYRTSLPSIEDNVTLVWVGQGRAYVFEESTYVRDETNDYAFEVIQRRYGNRWESVKNMHRIHPEYDGKAGPREQTMFFRIDFSLDEDSVISQVRSSLGNGAGHSDPEFRDQRLQFSADGISSFAPYNTYRITQEYRYEAGELLETVELFKLRDGEEAPFAKIEETAAIFRPTKLASAPTRFE